MSDGTGSRVAPADEAGVSAAVAAAHAEGVPLALEGRGTKAAMLRPVQAGRTLSLRNLSGITFYKPEEMVISARAGTPLDEIEAALAERRQQIMAEPPDLRAVMGSAAEAVGTIGGAVACNLSGPRRVVGFAMRDLVLGVRFVNGTGEVLRSGGRVHKNVTGLDLCKLLSGSHGTLGVITEVTLKVGPAGERTATLALPVADEAAAVAALSAGLTSPFGVTGAAMLPAGASAGGVSGPVALLRLEDVEASVTYRMARLQAALPGGRVLEEDESRALWGAVRDAAPLAAVAGEAVWRVSVRPSLAAGVVASLRAGIGARVMLDWGGGLVWVAAEATAAAHRAVMAAALGAGGTFTLFRAPDALRVSVPVIPDESPALAALSARVKAALDPGGRLNPGRMRAGG